MRLNADEELDRQEKEEEAEKEGRFLQRWR